MADNIQTKEYMMGQFRFKDTEIECNGFKMNWKIKADKSYPTNSITTSRVKFSELDLSWEASDINPKYRPFFKDKFKQQLANPSDLFTIATYDFNLGGDPVEDDVFYECWIEDVSKEDANGKFTVKGGAKRMKF